MAANGRPSLAAPRWILPIRGRQASYGITTGSPAGFLTLRESFGEYDLSVEVGTITGEPVGQIAADATDEDIWNTLAALEGITTTYSQQQEARRRDAEADALDDGPPT